MNEMTPWDKPEEYLNEQPDLPDASDLAQPMDDETLVGLVSEELALNAPDGDETTYTSSLKYYFGKPRGDEIAGRSTIQSLDVAYMTDAILAQVTPVFTSDNVVTFEARDAQDEQRVQEESKFCNHVIMNQNPGYSLFYQATQDALLNRNCVVKVRKEEKVTVSEEEYSGLTDSELEKVLQPRPREEIQVVEHENTGVPTLEMTAPSVMDVHPQAPPPQNIHDLSLKRITSTKRLVCESVPMDEFRYSKDLRSTDVSESPFTAHVRPVVRNDLVAVGYDPETVMSLPAYRASGNETTNIRNPDADTSLGTTELSERVLVAECYYLVDYDGDGLAELRKVVLGGVSESGGSGGVLLENVVVKTPPFAAGAAFLMAHRFEGISIYDKLKAVQDAKTSVLRQMGDNQNLNNNPKTEVDISALVNPDDVKVSKPAQIIRTRRIGSIKTIPVNDIGPSCIRALEYLDKVRTDRAGAALDMQAQGNMVAGDTAHGMERQATSREQLSAMMARTLAETLVKSLYKLTHTMLREHFPESIQAKIGGEWKQTIPGAWPQRDTLNVDVGMSLGDRMRQKAALNDILQQQLLALDKGQDGVAVTATQVHNTLVDYARASGQNNPDRYWTNPESPEAKQKQQRNARAAQEAREKQDKVQQAMLSAQIKVANAEVEKANAARTKVQMQGVIDKMRMDIQQLENMGKSSAGMDELQFKYDEMVNRYSLELTKLELENNTDLDDAYQENKTVQ